MFVDHVLSERYAARGRPDPGGLLLELLMSSRVSSRFFSDARHPRVSASMHKLRQIVVCVSISWPLMRPNRSVRWMGMPMKRTLTAKLINSGDAIWRLRWV